MGYGGGRGSEGDGERLGREEKRGAGVRGEGLNGGREKRKERTSRAGSS